MAGSRSGIRKQGWPRQLHTSIHIWPHCSAESSRNFSRFTTSSSFEGDGCPEAEKPRSSSLPPRALTCGTACEMALAVGASGTKRTPATTAAVAGKPVSNLQLPRAAAPAGNVVKARSMAVVIFAPAPGRRWKPLALVAALVSGDDMRAPLSMAPLLLPCLCPYVAVAVGRSR